MAKYVFLIHGEALFAQEKYDQIVQAVQKKFPGETAFQTFRLSETPLAEVLTQARTLPFLAAAQVFRLREAESLKAADVEALDRYLASPAPATFLVFESTTGEPSAGLQTLIRSRGEVFTADRREKKSTVSRFVREKLKHCQVSVDPTARARLEALGEAAPAFLDSLLEQLIAYAGPGKKITEAMVETFEEKWEEIDGFKLAQAVAAGHTGEALAALRKLMEEDAREIVPLIGILHWQLRRFWQARCLLDEGKTEDDVLRKCRLSPRQARFFLKDVRGLSREKLERALEGLFELDWKLKTGRGEGTAAAETWLVKATT